MKYLKEKTWAKIALIAAIILLACWIVSLITFINSFATVVNYVNAEVQKAMGDNINPDSRAFIESLLAIFPNLFLGIAIFVYAFGLIPVVLGAVMAFTGRAKSVALVFGIIGVILKGMAIPYAILMMMANPLGGVMKLLELAGIIMIIVACAMGKKDPELAAAPVQPAPAQPAEQKVEAEVVELKEEASAEEPKE